MGVLQGKVAIITGAGQGIGKAIALRFAREGAEIAIGDVNLDTMEAVRREIEESGRVAVAVKTDVSIKHDVENLVATAIDAFTRVDVLVNNAGIMRRAPLLEMTEEDWDIVLDVCLKGVFLCTQAVARHMVAQGSGRIINLASTAGLGTADESMANYGAAKAGVVELTKVTARALGRYGIGVAAIAPGTIQTEIERSRKTPEEYAAFIDQRKMITVLGRVGEVDDVAALATFLASDESSFITGAVIPVDGGRFDKL